MILRRILLVVLLLGAAAAAHAAGPAEDGFWYGTAADGGPSVKLYFFWTPTCPHCQAAQPFIRALPGRLPWVEVHSYPVKDNPDNARLYIETAEALGQEATSVPGFIFCRSFVSGFDTPETTGEEIVRQLEGCRAGLRSAADPRTADRQAAAPAVRLPFVGSVDAGRWSLPVLTVVLAGMDAFNPCAFFVLLFLLSLLVHAQSRTRMLVVGGTFVLFSGIVYFVFMAAWLNVFLIAGELRAATVAAGVLALLVGALNIKDYFWFKRGVSLSIPESAKPGLFRRMRQVVAAGSVGPMLASTVLLAIVANSYELLCTAGFPMVYTRALTLAGLEPWQRYAYLAAYNAIYVLPLLAIVLAFVHTMGSRKLTESEGRVLKLVSGFMMAGFGAILLFVPQLMLNALASVLVIVAAGLAAAVTVMVVPRRD